MYQSDIELIEVDPSTVGQFTGLVDSDNKKIFEGDILKIKWTTWSTGGYFQMDDATCDHEEIVKVEYVQSRFVFTKKDGRQMSAAKNHKSFIIGNIHDTPELLKGGKQ